MATFEYSAEQNNKGLLAEETQCLEAIRKGDGHAFRELFEKWYNPLLRFSFRYVKSEMIAEGVVQDIFLWIWENRENWKVEGSLKTYLFRAVKYRSMDYWRQEKRREQYYQQLKYRNVVEGLFGSSADIDNFFDDESEGEFVHAVQKAIEELPERPKMIYKLHRLEGFTYKEIAEILSLSPKTVEVHMSRALDFLRKKMAKYLPILILFESGMSSISIL